VLRGPHRRKGKILKRGKLSSDQKGLRAFMEVAMEAGYCWQPFIDDQAEDGYGGGL
jgi:hypothetical protein